MWGNSLRNSILVSRIYEAVAIIIMGVLFFVSVFDIAERNMPIKTIINLLFNKERQHFLNDYECLVHYLFLKYAEYDI